MASLSSIFVLPISKLPPCKSSTPHVPSSSCSFFPRISHNKRTRIPSVSCTGNNDNESNTLQRRDVLIALGGLYGATTGPLSSKNLAFASPIKTPVDCLAPNLPAGSVEVACCPTENAEKGGKGPMPFQFPKGEKLKIRPAAHKVDDKYIDTFEAAIQIMKDMPESDPRSFLNQAKVHCAYCDGTYVQNTDAKLSIKGQQQLIDVHGSWVFFPFHRAYLYFFERILAKIAKEEVSPDLRVDNFAIPYWNWDTEEGMPMPAIYTRSYNSPLYDLYRNRDHLPPTLIDLNWPNNNDDVPDQQMIERNYRFMYQQMITKSSTPKDFFGNPLRYGDTPPTGSGQGETAPHNNVHRWVGSLTQTNGEDMGRLYSAGKDPLFYAHHANVDRMWNIWNTLTDYNAKSQDPSNQDFQYLLDDDFRQTSFLLYDEEGELRSITIEDCLDTQKLGYSYQDETDLPWNDKKYSGDVPIDDKPSPGGKLPIEKLEKGVSLTIVRPKAFIGRQNREKSFQEETLVLKGVTHPKDNFIKFDVYVNRFFAGTYSWLPRLKQKDNTEKKDVKFGITKLVDRIGASNDDKIIVDIIPRFERKSTEKGRVGITNVVLTLENIRG